MVDIKSFETLPCSKLLPSSPLQLSTSQSRPTSTTCSRCWMAKKKHLGTINMHGQDPFDANGRLSYGNYTPKQDKKSTNRDQDDQQKLITVPPLQCQTVLPPLLPLTSSSSNTSAGRLPHERRIIVEKYNRRLRNDARDMMDMNNGGVDPVLLWKGRLDKVDRIFRQEFNIRSFDIGFDKIASLESLMNFSQEAYLNHMKTSGLAVGDFGVTLEMNTRELIWVYSTLQVAVDYYPSWGDIVRAETWFCTSGKNGLRLDCIFTDSKTSCTIMRVSSLCAMINKQTRKLSKFIGSVKEEMGPHFRTSEPILEKDGGKLPKLDKDTAGYIRKGLRPQWSDLDVNQHVNNVKFISWILEGTPTSIRESHELSGMTLEYRKECSRESLLESLSTVSSVSCIQEYKLNHFLCLEDGTEIARASTSWRPKK